MIIVAYKVFFSLSVHRESVQLVYNDIISWYHVSVRYCLRLFILFFIVLNSNFEGELAIFINMIFFYTETRFHNTKNNIKER